ncbi:MAG: NAD(P)H-binding protein [Bauldia sp.]
MKLAILGATGDSGRRLVRAALADGHEVTAIVRDAAKAAALAAPRLTIRQVAFSDHAALVAALRGHDAVINAAGYLRDGPAFVALVQAVIRAAAEALGPGGRFWLFGGAGVLDVPGKSITSLELPGIPKISEAHRTNWNAVKATDLDWSMLCPGPMVEAPNGEASRGLVVTADTWPVALPGFTNFLPRPALSLAFIQAVPRLRISYEDAARAILDNLGKNGPFSKKRVGVALADGKARAG